MKQAGKGMPDLCNKTILILSPQDWGTMFLSKHHYAVGLARKGNKVYFLNPPAQDQPFNCRHHISVTPSGVAEGLFLINHRLGFPYALKFHAKPVYNALVRFHIKRLLRAIGGRPDIVWSFDLGDLYPFRFFGNHSYRIFHPVDEPLNRTAIDSARDAHVIFSVTREILEKYAAYGIPTHFINHGLSDEFLLSQPPQVEKGPGVSGAVRVGFAGNLLRNDIDREVMLKIVRGNPAVLFEYWGSYTGGQSNIGGATDNDTTEFIGTLRSCPNVILHGPVSAARLASDIQRMDGFLICYDVKRDQSHGTNYHKIMEYLSTGKVVISNNVTTYRQFPRLVQMVEEREHNTRLPELFRQVITRLEDYNRLDLQQERRAFARDNTYTIQIKRIENIIIGR